MWTSVLLIIDMIRIEQTVEIFISFSLYYEANGREHWSVSISRFGEMDSDQKNLKSSPSVTNLNTGIFRNASTPAASSCTASL